MKLNLGCGHDVREGWVNADVSPCDSRVLYVNLDKPFPDGWWRACEEIVMQDVLEHLDDPEGCLENCAACLQPAGVLKVRGPHYTCRDTFTDLTHRRGLSSETMSRWANRNGMTATVRLGFEPWNLWMAWVNLHPMGMKLYEATLLRALAPAKHVHAELRPQTVSVPL